MSACVWSVLPTRNAYLSRGSTAVAGRHGVGHSFREQLQPSLQMQHDDGKQSAQSLWLGANCPNGQCSILLNSDLSPNLPSRWYKQELSEPRFHPLLAPYEYSRIVKSAAGDRQAILLSPQQQMPAVQIRCLNDWVVWAHTQDNATQIPADSLRESHPRLHHTPAKLLLSCPAGNKERCIDSVIGATAKSTWSIPALIATGTFTALEAEGGRALSSPSPATSSAPIFSSATSLLAFALSSAMLSTARPFRCSNCPESPLFLLTYFLAKATTTRAARVKVMGR